MTTVEVPVGQMFNGTIISRLGDKYSGRWYKASNGHNMLAKDGSKVIDTECVIVSLERPDVFFWNREIQDYEVIEATA